MTQTVIFVHTNFEVVTPGRIVILHLHGPLGNLDICCSYLDAGCPSERIATVSQLGKCIRPQASTLTILMGDFNFVCESEGRWSGTAERFAPNGNLKEAEHFEKTVLRPFGLLEWDQDHYTCDAKGARAR